MVCDFWSQRHEKRRMENVEEIHEFEWGQQDVVVAAGQKYLLKFHTLRDFLEEEEGLAGEGAMTMSYSL